MCINCWREYCSANITSDKTRALAELVKAVYDEDNVCGGLGHCVLDDWNLEDDFVQSTLEHLNDESWTAGFTAEHIAAVRACMEAMLACTLEERASALALRDDFIVDIPIIGERPH